MKKTDGLSADNLIRAVKIVFAECGLPKNTVSDAGKNFISDKLIQFCRQLNIQQAITSSYHHQNNGQVEPCIKFVKHTIRKCLILLNILLKAYVKQNILQDQTSLHYIKQHGFIRSEAKCYTYQKYTYHRWHH